MSLPCTNGTPPANTVIFDQTNTTIVSNFGGYIGSSERQLGIIFPKIFAETLRNECFEYSYNTDSRLKKIHEKVVVPFTKLEDTNQQLIEVVARKNAEIAELKQHQTKEVIMRQIIETLRINFAMEIEKKDKDCKQQLQEKDERLQEFKEIQEKDAELLKKQQKQLELNNCRMVNLNQRIVNLTKQTEERENLCNVLTKDLEEKDEEIEDFKNEVHEYYEETKRQNEAIEELKITNQDMGRLNYLLILGTSKKKINDFSPEF
jgi:chromosome segregation ATPase